MTSLSRTPVLQRSTEARPEPLLHLKPSQTISNHLKQQRSIGHGCIQDPAPFMTPPLGVKEETLALAHETRLTSWESTRVVPSGPSPHPCTRVRTQAASNANSPRQRGFGLRVGTNTHLARCAQQSVGHTHDFRNANAKTSKFLDQAKKNHP